MFELNKEAVWINPNLTPYEKARLKVDTNLIDDAEKRLERFKPFIAKAFPETIDGTIESKLIEAAAMRDCLNVSGRLLLKLDSHLPIAGSVKARGGVYEVLKHAEELALQNGLITPYDDYSKLTEYRDFFSKYKLQVGSTGNLGISIGISGAAVGFDVTVHMSSDAKQWKKQLLRSHGVHVIEYSSDYTEAVRQGRFESDKDASSYFIDDEKSLDLFLGYAVAAARLDRQLKQMGIEVSAENQLIVHLPCGVGGAPGGIAYGLKAIYKDNVHVFFAEPVQCPCVLLGMATGKGSGVSVQDYGLSSQTEADGLAVSRPSQLVCEAMENLLSGGFTMTDENLSKWQKLLYQTESISVEPSACAGFAGVCGMESYDSAQQYLSEKGINLENSIQIAWLTGGALVPPDVMLKYLEE